MSRDLALTNPTHRLRRRQASVQRPHATPCPVMSLPRCFERSLHEMYSESQWCASSGPINLDARPFRSTRTVHWSGGLCDCSCPATHRRRLALGHLSLPSVDNGFRSRYRRYRRCRRCRCHGTGAAHWCYLLLLLLLLPARQRDAAAATSIHPQRMQLHRLLHPRSPAPAHPGTRVLSIQPPSPLVNAPSLLDV